MLKMILNHRELLVSKRLWNVANKWKMLHQLAGSGISAEVNFLSWTLVGNFILIINNFQNIFPQHILYKHSSAIRELFLYKLLLPRAHHRVRILKRLVGFRRLVSFHSLLQFPAYAIFFLHSKWQPLVSSMPHLFYFWQEVPTALYGETETFISNPKPTHLIKILIKSLTIWIGELNKKL